MAASACKVILCGNDSSDSVNLIVSFADAVQRGDIELTPEVEAALNEAAKRLESVTASLRKTAKLLMVAGFPKA